VLLRGVARADTQTDAQATLQAWLDAQNGGHFAAYSALYDAKFVGVVRAADGDETTKTWKAWKRDRKKRFKHAQQVAADDVHVKPIEGGAVVTFLERWKGSGHADHGTEVIVMRGGKIVHEERLFSDP